MTGYRLARAGAIGLALALASLPADALASVKVVTDIGSVPSLSVNGDGSPDRVAVSYDAGAGKLIIAAPNISETTPACNDNGNSVSCTPPSGSFGPVPAGVNFFLGSGDDTLTVDGSVPAALFFREVGGEGTDTISAGPESDSIDPGSGPDRVSGGAGEDEVGYAQRVTPVNAILDGSPTSGNELDGPPGARDILSSNIEDLVGGNASDRLVGNALTNTIVGFKGRDVLIGLGGSDRLAGEGLGIDFAVGTTEANRLYGGKGRDFLLGGAGGDQLFGGPGIDRIDAKDKQHEKTINCGAGNDRRERATRDGGDPHPISC